MKYDKKVIEFMKAHSEYDLVFILEEAEFISKGKSMCYESMSHYAQVFNLTPRQFCKLIVYLNIAGDDIDEFINIAEEGRISIVRWRITKLRKSKTVKELNEIDRLLDFAILNKKMKGKLKVYYNEYIKVIDYYNSIHRCPNYFYQYL